MNTFKRVLIGILISLGIAIPALWAATYTTQKLVVTDNIKVDTLQSNAGTDTVTIVELKSAVDLKHAPGGGGGGIGNSGSTPGYLAEWTGSDTVGNSTDTDTDIHNAVLNSHAGSHSGTAGKIPVFSGTNTLGDSGQTDTQMRTRHLRFACLPNSVAVDTGICVVPKLDAAITIINLEVSCDVNPDTQIAGDILYADTSFVARGSPVVINDFDTTAGVRSDSSITNPAVAVGKCIYFKFDTTPSAKISQVSFDITYIQ